MRSLHAELQVLGPPLEGESEAAAVVVSKSATAQAEWYAKNKHVAGAFIPGGKGLAARRPLQTDMTEQHVKRAGVSQKKRQVWNPYARWEEKELMKCPGKDLGALKAEWRMLRLNPNSSVKKVDGGVVRVRAPRPGGRLHGE